LGAPDPLLLCITKENRTLSIILPTYTVGFIAGKGKKKKEEKKTVE
jgi:hypothetical protein